MTKPKEKGVGKDTLLPYGANCKAVDMDAGRGKVLGTLVKPTTVVDLFLDYHPIKS